MSVPLRRILVKRDHHIGYERCIGCEKEVNPAFAYTGEMITGVRFHTVEGTQKLPILGYLRCLNDVHILGGQEVKVQRKVAALSRKKGCICTDCAANYHTVEDASGKWHPVIKLDARPGFLGEIAQYEGPKPSYKTLNTRFTR